MANRHYTGDEDQNAFIEVDLLPQMRRPRQFNVNVLLVVLVAVFASWLLIYLPLNGRQDALDDTLETNNDLTNEEVFINETIESYGIEKERIDFQAHLENAKGLQTNYAEQLEGIENAISAVEPDGRFLSVSYDAVNEEFYIGVTLNRQISFQNVNIEILELDFVNSASYSSPESIKGSSWYRARFTIEVDPDAF
ncbi:MAG: hypothetical protein ACOCU5_02370 [Bacillota bacterium]